MWNWKNIKNKKTNSAAYLGAKVLGKDEKEFYLEIAIKTAEKYGKHSLAYKTITNGINISKVSGVHFFWVSNISSYLPQHQRVISLKDMEMIADSDESFFSGFYSYVPEVILRSEIPIYPNERYILEDLVRQIKNEKHEFSSEKPLRISGLELVKDQNLDNAYGLLMKVCSGTKISIDKRFSFSNSGKEIPFGRNTKNSWTGKNGLSAICQGGGSYLYTDGGFALYADCTCRVVVINY